MDDAIETAVEGMFQNVAKQQEEAIRKALERLLGRPIDESNLPSEVRLLRLHKHITPERIEYFAGGHRIVSFDRWGEPGLDGTKLTYKYATYTPVKLVSTPYKGCEYCSE